MKLGPIISLLACTIGAHRGAILRSYGSIVTQTREMSEGHTGGQAESGSTGSSRGSSWRGRRQKRCEDRERVQAKKNLAWERGQTRLAERCPVPRDMGSVTRGTKS